MSSKKRTVRKNIHPYLNQRLYDRFKGYCWKMGVTESSVVEEALTRFLDEQGDMPLVLRKIDRQTRSIERMDRDVKALSEAFSVFVQVYFAHTPEIPEDEKQIAQHDARSRYLKFLDYVAEQISSGHTLVDDLVKDSVADPDELRRLIDKENRTRDPDA